MKKLTTILILLLSIATTYAQDQALDLKTKGLFVDNTFRVFSSPQLQIRKKQHVWAVGPSIAVASEKTTSDKDYPKLVGIQASYSYYPINNQGSKFSCFLFDDLLLTRVVDYWSAAIWNQEQHTYKNYNYESAEILIANHVGYGIQLNLGRKFYISQSVEAGVYYSVTDNDENSSGAPEIADHNIKGYDPIGFSWGLNFQVGIQL